MNLVVYIVAVALWSFIAEKTFDAPWYVSSAAYLVGCWVLYYCVVLQHEKPTKEE